MSTQTQVGKPRRTNPSRFNADREGKRRATLFKRVHVVRTRGERIKVSFDPKGQPIGKAGDELQSWIGVLAREHIPIWIADFRSADLEPRKERVWAEVVTSFTVDESHKKQVLKSCGERPNVLDMIFTKRLLGIILRKKQFGNDRLKWLTITQPSARTIGKCLLPIDGRQISRGYPNKEAR